MEEQLAPGFAPSVRRTAFLTLLSGVVGLAAICFLIAAVTTRTTWSISRHVQLLFRIHDGGVVLQFLLLIPFSIKVRKLSRGHFRAISTGATALGIGSIFLTTLLLLLGVCNLVNDMFYMLPQGLFGLWLIFINRRLVGLLPRWLSVFGMVVGLGLLLVGIVFPGLATFVYPNMWKIPAVPVDAETFSNTATNRILHLVLAVGSILGVVTLPIWTIVTGSKLLREKL